jgi:probable rRNA maturation factor
MRTKSTAKRRRRSSVAVQRAARGAPAPRRLRAWALAAARPGAEVTVRVVGAAEARLLNRAFRRRDYATNVLSFSYSPTQGDVVLCHPVIAREARAQGKPLAAHYAHLVVHGMLHLRGMDHARAADARRMERAEIRLLARLGFGDPYAVE